MNSLKDKILIDITIYLGWNQLKKRKCDDHQSKFFTVTLW